MAVILIDNYDSFTYNLYQLVQGLVADPIEVYRNDAITIEALAEKKPSHVILSPGPGHPAIPTDFGVCRDVILQFPMLSCPVLGVCLGHQGIAHHLGGTVVKAPAIVHGKTSPVAIQKASPLLEGLSNPFTAMRYHSLVVAEDETFPSDTLEVTAKDTQDNLVMALQHKTLPIYGIQFHPESIGTPEGLTLLRNFIEKC